MIALVRSRARAEQLSTLPRPKRDTWSPLESCVRVRLSPRAPPGEQTAMAAILRSAIRRDRVNDIGGASLDVMRFGFWDRYGLAVTCPDGTKMGEQT